MKHKKIISLIVVLVIILIYYNWVHKFSYRNTKQEKICDNNDCGIFNVHSGHHDPEAAANLLKTITSRNYALIEHLRSKYLQSPDSINPDRSNSIDVVGGTELYSDNNDITNSYIQNSEYIQERINQLVQNYDINNIYEISPLNKDGVTSYAENKKKLILCLRSKSPNKNNEYELHDINTMMFVVIHELAHMMNDKWGHDEGTKFWNIFKFLLVNAQEIDIYQPVNYSHKPVVYCGLTLSYNPFYDDNL